MNFVDSDLFRISDLGFRDSDMIRRLAPPICFAALILLFLLHNDFWFWHDARLIFGLPVGLLYHIAYCIGASVLMYSMVRYAWLESLEVDAAEEREL